MAMRGWLASSNSFGANVDDPSVLSQLKKFSVDSGKGPFTFEIADVIDTPNLEPSPEGNPNDMRHSVWIEIFDKDKSKKLGEISVDATDSEIPSGSNQVLLAACLDKLGFVDEFEGLNDYQKENPPEDAQPDVDDAYQEDNLNPQDKIASYRQHAARILVAIASTGIGLAEDDYDPSMKKNDSGNFGTADDVRYQYRQQQAVLRREMEQIANQLNDGEYSLETYLDQANGNWNSIFDSANMNVRRLGFKFRTLLDNFIRARGLKALLGNQDLTSALRENKLPVKTGSAKIAQVITELDSFIEKGSKPPFILEVDSPAHIPEESNVTPSKLHVD